MTPGLVGCDDASACNWSGRTTPRSPAGANLRSVGALRVLGRRAGIAAGATVAAAALLLGAAPVRAEASEGGGVLPWTAWSPATPWAPVPQEPLLEGGETGARGAIQPPYGHGPDGGPGVAHHAGGRPEPSPARPIPQGVQFPTGEVAREPSIGITRDGSIFVDAWDGETALDKILRSSDGGRTWKVLPLPVGDGAESEDPLLYIDPRTDRLFAFELTLPCSAIFMSDDGGAKFGQGLACNHADHQTLFAGPPPAGGAKPAGYPNVVYYCAIDGGASAAAGVTACSKSLDGGLTYTRTATPAYVSDGTRGGGSLGIPGYCYGATGHGRVGPDGTVYLPRGFCDQPFLAISPDEGDTWKLVQVSDLGMQTGTSAGVGIEEHEARVAIDPAGNVYYLWVARDRLPYLAVSRDGGQHFGKPMMVAPPGVNEAWGPALEAGDTGRIALSYFATTNSPGPPFCARTTPTSCVNADGSPGRPSSDWDKTTWNGYISESVDALAADPTFYTASVNDPRDPYTRGVCGSVQCEPTHEFHGVSIAADGTAWASFVDGCSTDPSDGCPGTAGTVGHLVGGPPLVGSAADQRPGVVLPPASSPGGRPAGGRRACRSRRRFTIHLREPKRGRLARARVYVNGKRVRVLRGRRLRARVNLRGLPKGRYTVRVVAVTTTGRRVTEKRRYRTCRPGRAR